MEIDFTFCKYTNESSNNYESQKWIYYLTNIFEIFEITGNILSIILITLIISCRKIYLKIRTDVGVSLIDRKKATFKKYWCHTFRNILLLNLITVRCLSCFETFIRWFYSVENSVLWINIFGSLFSLICVILIQVYLECLEKLAAHQLYLVLPLFLWCFQVSSAIVRFYEITFRYCVSVNAVAPSLQLVIVAETICLIIIDVSTIVRWIWLDRRKQSLIVNSQREEKSAIADRNPRQANFQNTKPPKIYNFGTFQFKSSPSSSSTNNAVEYIPSGDSSEDLEKSDGFSEEDSSKGEEKLRFCHTDISFLSKFTHKWYLKILRRGWQNPLEFSDLDSIPAEYATKNQYENLQKSCELIKESREGFTSLWRAFLSTYWRPILVAGVLKFFGDIINVVGPLVIAPIVRFVKSIQEGTWELHGQMHYEVYFVGWSEFVLNGWILCFLAFVASILQSTFSQESTNILTTEGIRVRTALQAKIYDKTLKVSVAITNRPKEKYNDATTTTVHTMDSARVINLSTEDTENVMRFFMHCHYLWAIPFKVSFLVALLYLQMGISAFYATGISVLFLVPLQFFLGKSIKKVNARILETGDERLSKTNELITCIRALKIMVLEELFLERVSAARKEELHFLLKDGMLRALLTFLTQASGIMIILLAFSFYSLLQDKLPEEGVIFSSLSLFSQLTVALFLLPSIVQHTSKAVGSVKRLEEFFAEPEVKPKPEISETVPTANGENMSPVTEENIITIKNADFAYGDFVDDIVLKNISTTVQKGKLTVVVGGVGSGKSSFLLSLLGEANKLAGSIQWASKSNIAYVSQAPWLLNATLRENILIGRGFQTKKYKRVLGICALQPDIDLLPDGDSTEIGERGVNLSGGQKARVSLARALYSELPLLILDCPFSALDANVACQVFQQIVNYHNKKALNCTIVLATQHYRLCTAADKVIYLENKSIAFEGEPQDILKSCPDLMDKLALQLGKCASPDSALPNNDNFEIISPSRYMSRASRRSRFSPQFGLAIEMDKSFMGAANRRSFSLLRSSALHAVLPSDELESLSDPPVLRRRKSRLPKNSLFRTTSSSPAFERFEDDLKEKSRFQRRHAKSLPSRPTTTKDVSKEAGRDNSITKKELKRKESIIRKLFTPHPSSRRRSQKMERRPTNTNIWSVLWRKGLQIPEQDENETDSIEEDSEDYEDSDSIVCKAFINEEERERGKISKWIYFSYLKACGLVLGSFYIAFMIANQGLLITLDIWLGHWSKMCQEENCTATLSKNLDQCIKDARLSSDNFNKSEVESICLGTEETVGSSYILIFGLLSGLSISVGFVSICLNQLAAHRGRRTLHDKMLRAVVGTKVRFFDLTPVGRILNRFSTDISLIDKDMGWSVMHFFYFSLLCLSAILVNSVVSPIFILVSIPVCFIYYVIQHVFRCSSRELKRLESLSLSPVLTLITETAYCPPVIRSYGLQSRFFACFCRRVDAYLSSSFLFHAGNRWLGITLDYMGCLIVFMSTLACLIGSTTEMTTLLPPMAVGLAIKYTLTIPVYLNWLVRYLSSTEVCLNSVERVLQYTRLSPEAEEFDKVECCAKKKCKCSKSFKRRMNSVLKYDMERYLLKRQEHIVFENVDLYYDKNAQPVVSQVSFKIPAGQKVGVCGRTGSGKSSLVMGLLRMTERQEGRILFNGFDVKKMPHFILREQIAVISQDVCIFKDTLRFNVDLESKYTDENIWEALEKVQLKDMVSSLPKELDTVVGSGNLVLSAGQSQLLVLSRILLDKRNLVVLDEFAAMMDTHLESQLLSMIKTELSNSTIIMVTHNTSSLLSCDRILSISEGKLVEDGSPTELRNQPDGIFSSLLRADSH